MIWLFIIVICFGIGFYRMYKREQYKELCLGMLALIILVLALYLNSEYHWITKNESNGDW